MLARIPRFHTNIETFDILISLILSRLSLVTVLIACVRDTIIHTPFVSIAVLAAAFHATGC